MRGIEIFQKNRESVKSADIETADIGDPLYVETWHFHLICD